MPLFLKYRQPFLMEKMDQDDCDPVKLENTYRQFTTINVLLSKWRKVYKEYLLPKMNVYGRKYTLLDIGFGGGDIPIALTRWAQKDGIDLEITAIETDRRAFEYILQKELPPGVTFRNCSSSDLVIEGEQYDFVISNHVLHHLDDDSLLPLLKDAQRLSKRIVIFNDIERSDLGYALFTTLTRPIFFNSFIIEDGLTSIKRSFTKGELQRLVSVEWEVKRLFPFRLLLVFSKDNPSL